MKTKDIKQRIKKYFFENPTARLRVRQIERAVKVPLPSAIRYARELEAESFLKSHEISGVNFYSANRGSKRFLAEKRAFNTKQLFDCSLIDYLAEEYGNPVVIVFGSYSSGEDIEKSDIDLYIETQKKHDFKLEKFEKILNRKIQVFNYQSLDKIPNKALANNMLNGTILNGFVEVFK